MSLRSDSTEPRLNTLSPIGVAQEVLAATLHHVLKVARLAGVECDTRRTPPLESKLGQYTQRLTTFAQNGGETDGVDEALAAVCDALFTTPAQYLASVPAQPARGDGDLTRAVEVVIAAATARLCVERVLGVPSRGLAALAGTTESRIRQLIMKEELNRDGTGHIRPRDAKSWLISLGIAGFVPRPSPQTVTLLCHLNGRDWEATPRDLEAYGRQVVTAAQIDRFGLADVVAKRNPPTGIELWNKLSRAIERGHGGALAYALAKHGMPNSALEIDSILAAYQEMLRAKV